MKNIISLSLKLFFFKNKTNDIYFKDVNQYPKTKQAIIFITFQSLY